ncbi:Nif3-like dinuclear metal center hexameric protein [Chondrinema litorale]|uniref:Nif3-like dinuclear metal center hexameric protein n=1 Tax=Chondrinema litorale TaxID=2994555 RepID=UPI00254432DE|nr:Nif3-like dinuclear metal center hexameric protein [Chondrinema litorale]UZR93871.1 Nif3-like dinuclear metal center hexameric protein [Chondrinema litorale]
MTKVKDITRFLETIAPLSLQESYDNAGLITGDPNMEITGVLCTLDSTEEILAEAIEKKCNMVVAHHPIVFSGLKKLNGKNYVERTIIKAIKNDIAIYAIHTNLDNVQIGVNAMICNKLGIKNTSILASGKDSLLKLVSFVPVEHTDKILNALGEAGAGAIGNYKNCSFSIEGEGRFQPDDAANPYIGEAGKLEKVKENKVEVIFPKSIKGKVMQALRNSHPYEEIAFDIYLLENRDKETGSGMIGELETAMPAIDFLHLVKEKMNCKSIRHTALLEKPIKKVAVCGGAGSFLLNYAIGANADIFITADYKYHQFFDADNKIIIADIGHYESEQYTKELLAGWLREKFQHNSILVTERNTNPVYYL